MKKNTLMSYKNYHGSVNFDTEAMIFYGQIEFIRDLVNYEAKDADNLLKAFYEAVDNYLDDCKILGKTPDKPFKGSFEYILKANGNTNLFLIGESAQRTL
jgi:predicted HicB family RNase H-like nuclease